MTRLKECDASVMTCISPEQDTTVWGISEKIVKFTNLLESAKPASDIVFVSYAGHAVQLDQDSEIYILSSDFTFKVIRTNVRSTWISSQSL